jgi:hypothetical protein
VADEVCGCISFGRFLSGEWVPSGTSFSASVSPQKNGFSCVTLCSSSNDSDAESLEGKVDVGRISGKGGSSVFWMTFGESAAWPALEACSPFPAYKGRQVNLVVIFDALWQMGLLRKRLFSLFVPIEELFSLRFSRVLH